MNFSATQEKFPLVGVGASAGGVDSFQKFLSAIPANSGMAYILVQHLSPSHESKLPEILSHATSIPVQEITDNCKIEPNHIYVIPENHMLEVTDHSLNLSPRKKNGPNMPIDIFFSSLAQVHGSFAIGVVLSGTARDGTVGLRDIKDHGGITFAEDPNSALWDGMPKNAIEMGVVDFVLPVEQIPTKLINVFALYETDAMGEEAQSKIDENWVKKILMVVQKNSGVDFSYYKRPTIIRRIERRMAISQITGPANYLKFLSRNRPEQESLFQDLLIKVTSFFRNPEVFEELNKTVFTSLLEKRAFDEPIRIWVAACSTGEEVYSLAIGLFEALGGPAMRDNSNRAKIQIFATDISATAISKARSGVYSATEVQSVSEKQLKYYFTKMDGSYRVVKPVRDTIVFSVHNFLKDPPFGKLDLVSCRNVFIYLDPFLQQKALSTFHYALKENRFLLMGKSETIGTPSDLFVPISKEGKIYVRKPGTGRFMQISPEPRKVVEEVKGKSLPSLRASRTDFRKSAEAVLVSTYCPASVIVDGHMEVVHINGKVASFLSPQQGKPTHELMKMARKELAFELRNAVHKAKESQETVIKEGILIKDDGDRFSATIEIVPLTNILDPYYLILFRRKSQDNSFLERVWKKLGSTSFTSAGKSSTEQRSKALEKELEQAREDMRSISEEQEAYGEELQSTNEELLSSNEEMQSVNEELETSKEELQSTNEELIVVNREIIEKQDEQNKTLYYLESVIANLREPFLVLEKDLRVQMANTSYYKKFDANQKETEGEQFFEIQNGRWNNAKLRTLIEKLLPTKEHVVDEEIVIKSASGGERSFMFNAREIKHEKESDKLILLSIEDITERKMTQGYKDTIAELKKTNKQLDRYVHVASHDLQEPLRKIIIFSERLRENGKFRSEQDREMVNKIESSASRMTGLIQGLLAYSRLAHHGDMFEQTDLNEIVKDIQSDFEVLIQENKALLKIGELPVLEAIPLQMNQLFHNLISNALKFFKKGVSPIVEISSRELPRKEIKKHPLLDPEQSYFEVVVADNGMGFNPKYQDQIFIIFQRLRQSIKQNGTGIGLSLAKRIAENHHGEIFAVAEEGEGAAFSVILPVRQPGNMAPDTMTNLSGS